MKSNHRIFLLLTINLLLAACTATMSSPSQGKAIPPETTLSPQLEEETPDIVEQTQEMISSEEDAMQPATRPETALSIQVEEDIPYMEGRTLDIYSPEEDASWPIVMALHGGGGFSKSLADLSAKIAANGAVVFTPTWSSLPPQPDYITRGWDEVACAMHFAQKYAAERGFVDPRFVIIGHSAGGASGFVALLAADELTGGECPTKNKLNHADAFIGLDGAYNILNYVPATRLEEGNPDEWERINPYHYLDKSHFRENIDIVFVSGSTKELEEEAGKFKEAVEQAGYTATHLRLPALNHHGVATPIQEVMDIIMDVLYPN